MKKFRSIFLLLITMLFSMSFVACGKNESPHVHSWTEATCTSSKKCLECGEEDGLPLGHLVRVGTCSRCGELSLDLITNVRNISEANENITEAILSCAEELSTSYEFVTDQYQKKYVLRAELEFLKISTYVQEGIESCGSYPEFENVKAQFSSILQIFNSKCVQVDGIYMLGTYKTIRNDLISLCTAMANNTEIIIDYLSDWLED